MKKCLRWYYVLQKITIEQGTCYFRVCEGQKEGLIIIIYDTCEITQNDKWLSIAKDKHMEQETATNHSELQLKIWLKTKE